MDVTLIIIWNLEANQYFTHAMLSVPYNIMMWHVIYININNCTTFDVDTIEINILNHY